MFKLYDLIELQPSFTPMANGVSQDEMFLNYIKNDYNHFCTLIYILGIGGLTADLSVLKDKNGVFSKTGSSYGVPVRKLEPYTNFIIIDSDEKQKARAEKAKKSFGKDATIIGIDYAVESDRTVKTYSGMCHCGSIFTSRPFACCRACEAVIKST